MLPVLLLLAVAAPLAAQGLDFARDVEPVFHKKCYGCHGSAQQMSGLRLDDGAAALKGGYSGPAIVPGDAAASKLIERVSSDKQGFQMPPAGPRLSATDIAALKAWIDSGAQWPNRAAAPAKAASRKSVWSFAPIHKPAVPDVKSAWKRNNAIDAFVQARLEKEGIAPAAEADQLTLLRRVALDLTGLPPSPAEMNRFLADKDPRAYERAVDRLLESPRYGERWARQWLDLARYADSDGYEKDLPRPYAWRWRQWVIEALNADMPFDRFTTWQIAGDLLPNATAEQQMATGFHRNTLRNREGGVKLEQTFFEETVDRVNTVSTVWMGLTMGCSQCHDHKYDPITQKDYYSMYAFFGNIEEHDIDAPLPGESEPYGAKRAEYLAKRQALLEEYHVTELMPPWEEKLRLAAKNVGKWTDWDITYDVLFQMSDGGHRFLWTDPAKRTYKQQEILTDYFIEWYHFVAPPERWRELDYKTLKKKLRALKESYPQLSQAPAIYDRPDRQPNYMRVRGDWERLGIEVTPSTPASLPAMKTDGPATRLDLAKWLVSDENPLTARVAVNRMWQEFFGRGLVRTSEDFGLQGEPPSHPELLDWLAADFMEGGWRMKRMHKAIVMSATYRQRSSARPELAEKDPDNTLLARQSRIRLSAEAIRDSALAASGLLYDKVGGRSVYPPQPAGVNDLTYKWDTDRWLDSAAPDKYRRGLYVFFQRTSPYPQLMNFDAPDSNVAASRRRRSNTPLQALNLLNDPVFLEAADALAARVLRDGGTTFDARAGFAFRLALGRVPDDYEKQVMARLLESGAEKEAWTEVARALLNLDEFITRE
ncbi:MAG: PSD1 and planctomycete cytochrome C domain-containing protein [Bryobacteraceae bacterium]